METFRTQRCHQRHHPEFAIYFDKGKVLEQDAQWLIGHLESQVLSGIVFASGHTIQIGWMILKVASENEGWLTLQEPDFREMPIVFISCVNNTLSQLRMQKDTFESLILPTGPQFPSIRQSGIVCTKYYDSGGFFLSRSKEANSDSGWFVGCCDSGHDHNIAANLKRVSLYELACSRDELIKFLALPEGIAILHSPESFKIQYEEKTINPIHGSYLQKLLLQK